MPTGVRGQKRPGDVSGNAVRAMRIATREKRAEFAKRAAEKRWRNR